MSQETEVESQQLNSNFIGEFRKSDSSGLVHLNLAEGQRSAMLHFFHWNDLVLILRRLHLTTRPFYNYEQVCS